MHANRTATLRTPSSPRSLRSRGSALPGLLLATGLLLAPAARAEPPPFPDYELQRCCQLCPMASQRTAYATSYLKNFTTLVQGADGWLFRTDDDLRTDFGADAKALPELQRLREALAARGVDLVIVLQPPRGLMHRDKLPAEVRARYNADFARFSYVAALQQMRSAGITVPDFERLIYEGGRDAYFFRSDHHWRPEGARRTAEVVAQAIRALPVYAQLPKKKFVTRPTGYFGKRGTFDKAVQQICGYGAPEQYVRTYHTEPEGEAGASELFGEEQAPPIVLVGTSNSEPTYNFAGFLSEQLQVDILNAAVAGGGMDGSVLSYLASPEFDAQPPRILIWEIAPYHNISDQNFYRQAIPLVEGGCDGRPALVRGEATLKAGRNEVLFNGGGRVLDLRGKDHLLDLEFSTPAIGKLETVFWYTNGRRTSETLEARRLRNGRYVMELRRDGDYADLGFLSLDINVTEPLAQPVRVTARMCNRHAPGAIVTARGDGG